MDRARVSLSINKRSTYFEISHGICKISLANKRVEFQIGYVHYYIWNVIPRVVAKY